MADGSSSSTTAKYTVLTHMQENPESLQQLMEEKCNIIGFELFDRDRKKYGPDILGFIFSPTMDLSIDENLLDSMPNLKVLSLHSVGYDVIKDINIFRKRGVRIGNLSNATSVATADLAIGFILILSRRFTEAFHLYNTDVTSYQRLTGCFLGREVTGSTIGILGMGNIGFKVAERAKGFRMRILYHNRNKRPVTDESELGATYVPTLREMLPQVDFLVISCPLSPETKGIIGAKELASMKSTAILINVARGAIVDTDSLIDALQRGVIGGAGLDVTSPEPLPQGHPLFGMPNVIMTPHLGTNTVETRINMIKLCLENVITGIEVRSVRKPRSAVVWRKRYVFKPPRFPYYFWKTGVTTKPTEDEGSSEFQPAQADKYHVLVLLNETPLSIQKKVPFFRPIFLEQFNKDRVKYGRDIVGIAIGISPPLTIDRDLLDLMPNLKVISLISVGYDHVDLELCKERGIRVCNNPDVQSDACADLVMFLMLAVSRRTKTACHVYKEDSSMLGQLSFNHLGRDVTGSTVGILGMGSIGRRVAERAKGFRMKILYHNRRKRSVQDDAELGAVYVPYFMDMLPQLDFLVICCPLSSITKGMVGAKAFEMMKSSAVVVNISRGAVIDTDALVDALQRGLIGGAGLDVTNPEPLPQGHPLFDMPNVVLTPHVGSATVETRNNLVVQCLLNMLNGIEGRPIPSLL